MRYRKRNSKLKLLMILVIGISIGYALLSTTLKIDGVVNIKSSSWDIHWVNNRLKRSVYFFFY